MSNSNDSFSNRMESDAVFVVKDINHILILIGVFIFCIVGVIYCVSRIGGNETKEMLSTLPFIVILGFFVYLRLRAVLPGTIVNLSKDTVSFNGGGISANNLTDYLSPSFLFQFFRREEIKLSSIRQIIADQKTTISKKGVPITKYFLRFNGKFGSVSLKFQNEHKRDELYSLIRSANEMGSPIVRG